MHALVAILAVFVSQAPTGTGASLQLKSVVLYPNGVGYFERRGVLGPLGLASIPLEAGQLDDALKSLVMVSERGVASVEFASPTSAAAARAMAGLPEPGDQRSLSNLLRSLQGVEVLVRRQGGEADVKGRVIEVSDEPGAPDKEGARHPEQTLLVYGDAGLARVGLAELVSVRPTGSQVALAWTRAVSATAVKPERERLLVRGGAAGGAVMVGYTTEAPVWRTTYRLVLSEQAGRTPRLQGFALVHNDSDEPWNGVKVRLASGQPASFIFPLAAARYARRELRTPEDGLDPAPQLTGREVREHLRGSLDAVGVGEGVNVTGFHVTGRGGGAGLVSHGMGQGTLAGLSATLLEDGPTLLEPAAVSEAGDLFIYSVKEPVVLGARSSALLPIVDGSVTAERVSVLDDAGGVFTGVRLLNSMPLTLEGGTLAVFADGAYAGETQVDRVKPGEVRVLTHGLDVDLLLVRSKVREEGRLRRASLTGSARERLLELTRVDRLVHRLSLTSRAAVPRTVLVSLAASGYRVVRGADEDVRSPDQPRYARLTVEPRYKGEREVVEEGAVMQRLAVATLTSAQVSTLLALPGATEVSSLLGSLKVELERAEAAEARLAELDAQAKQLDADQTRLREDLAALGKGGAAAAAQQVGERLLRVEETRVRVGKEREAAAAVADLARRRLLLPAS